MTEHAKAGTNDERAACVHPIDSIHTVSVTTPRAEVDVTHWCRDCGAFRCRESVDNLRALSLSPWRAWESPRASTVRSKP